MNNIIVVSGPSGCGKSTLIRMLLKKYSDLLFSVSHTTREKREGEKEGIDYYFISEEDFLEKTDKGEFLEWARVHSRYYGTSWDEVNRKTMNNQVLILDLDVQGARNMKKKYPDALYVFVIPPSMKELKIRLVNRENRLDANIKERLNVAKDEISNFPLYDYIVVNDFLNQSFLALESIYISFLHSTPRQESLVKQLLGAPI